MINICYSQEHRFTSITYVIFYGNIKQLNALSCSALTLLQKVSTNSQPFSQISSQHDMLKTYQCCCIHSIKRNLYKLFTS